MKKSTIFIILLIISINIVYSQEILWQKSYRPFPETGSWAYSINTIENGSIMLIGTLIDRPLNHSYPFIMKVDNNGKEEWLKLIYTDNYYIISFSIYLTQNKDNSYTLCAGSNSIVVPWFYFYKFDLTQGGDSINLTMKTKENSPYIKGVPYFYKFEDGTFLYSLTQQVNGYFEGIIFNKTDSIGNNLWSKQLKDDGGDLQRITNPKLDWDGGFIFLTNSASDTGKTLVLYKTDKECNELWRKYFVTQYPNSRTDIYPTLDSCYVIMALYYDSIPDNYTVKLRKFDKNGDLIWQSKPYGGLWTLPYAMIVSDNNEYFCTGSTSKYDKFGRVDTTTTKGFLIKINDKGETVWDMKFGKDGVNNDFRYIAKGLNNEFFIAGNVENSASIVKIKDNTTDTKESPISIIENIFPNPAYPGESLSIQTNLSGSVKLSAYNSLGILVDYKSEEYLDSGTNIINYTPNSDLPSGVYWIRLESSGQSEIHSFIYMK